MARFEARFRDRREAGIQLAAELAQHRGHETLVLALPRGGIPVAFEIAKALAAPLDVILARKIGAPGHKELGLGALVEADPPELVLSEEMLRMVAPDVHYIEAERKRQAEEIERQRRRYRNGRPLAAVKHRTVVVVDDGIATGGTARAVLRMLARCEPATLVFAVPVAPADKVEEMAALADEFVCLAAPDPFGAVGQYYVNFDQVSDEEVVSLLEEARARTQICPARIEPAEADDVVVEAGRESFPASDPPAF